MTRFQEYCRKKQCRRKRWGPLVVFSKSHWEQWDYTSLTRVVSLMHEHRGFYLVLKGHHEQFMLFLSFFFPLTLGTSWLSQLLLFFTDFGLAHNSSAWLQFITQQKLFVPLQLYYSKCSLNYLLVLNYHF